MANYVKFYRGTTKAYNNLAVKNDDTLYFVYETDASTGKLYLGSKLISDSSSENGGSQGGVFNLSELRDVLISEDLTDNSFLVYDNDSKRWINKSIEDLLFVGATENSAGLSGLVPAAPPGETGLFLCSDGNWRIPEIDHTFITIENTNKSLHSDLLTAESHKFVPISGDIIIIKDLISNDKWQYTAYVYDNNKWQAMDGNYNANNVYFNEDLITTTPIGNIELVDGQAIIPVAGKNLKQIFDMLYVQEKNPIITNPSISLTFNQAKAYEVGSVITPTYTASFNEGSYSYGPATGITVSEWSATDTIGNTLATASGAFPNITVIDNIDYKITVTASYNQGAIPMTNLGNEYPEGQIQMGSVSTTAKNGIIGYRNSFYGTLTNKNELTADIIRGLTASNAKLSNGAVKRVNIPTGALRVIIAYPATLRNLSSVTDSNGLNAEILSSFKSTTLNIPGANGYDGIDYKVYYADFAQPITKTNIYTFTI